MIKNTEAKVTAAFFFFTKIYIIKMNESIIYLFFWISFFNPEKINLSKSVL